MTIMKWTKPDGIVIDIENSMPIVAELNRLKTVIDQPQSREKNALTRAMYRAVYADWRLIRIEEIDFEVKVIKRVIRVLANRLLLWSEHLNADKVTEDLSPAMREIFSNCNADSISRAIAEEALELLDEYRIPSSDLLPQSIQASRALFACAGGLASELSNIRPYFDNADPDHPAWEKFRDIAWPQYIAAKKKYSEALDHAGL